jgi:UDP-N-acetylglucosamine 2-epimerase
MSEALFEELGMPEPEVNLQVGSGSCAQQTAAIMARFESIVLENKPDMVLVYGDVNSTVAAAQVCAKTLTPVTHVEAGLRSFDRAMPEEINRVLTDNLSDLLLAPSIDANYNLIREGLPAEKIKLVGNVMIDNFSALAPHSHGEVADGSAITLCTCDHAPAGQRGRSRVLGKLFSSAQGGRQRTADCFPDSPPHEAARNGLWHQSIA